MTPTRVLEGLKVLYCRFLLVLLIRPSQCLCTGLKLSILSCVDEIGHHLSKTGPSEGEKMRVAAVNTLKAVMADLLAERVKSSHEKTNIRKDLGLILDLHREIIQSGGPIAEVLPRLREQVRAVC